MKNKVLVVYQFATFGGVERVLLNRAEAFKYYKKNYKIYVYFYEDYGAKKSLRKYIEKEGLEDYIEIVDTLNPGKYDIIISIDTPQIFANKNINAANIYIESHTYEKKYRTYLNEYIGKVKKVIVPSKVFYNKITSEYKIKDKNSIAVIKNFIPWDMKSEIDSRVIQLPKWNKNLVFYYGRMDSNKNTKELIKATKLYNENYKEKILLILIGRIDPEYKLENFINKEHMTDSVILLPPIIFNKIPTLLKTMKANNAIFISSSKGETYSLSAAESIFFDIPVILSDIEAHKELLQNDKDFLYELEDINDMIYKINKTFKNYDAVSNRLNKLKETLTAKEFVKNWEELFESENN